MVEVLPISFEVHTRRSYVKHFCTFFPLYNLLWTSSLHSMHSMWNWWFSLSTCCWSTVCIELACVSMVTTPQIMDLNHWNWPVVDYLNLCHFCSYNLHFGLECHLLNSIRDWFPSLFWECTTRPRSFFQLHYQVNMSLTDATTFCISMESAFWTPFWCTFRPISPWLPRLQNQFNLETMSEQVRI